MKIPKIGDPLALSESLVIITIIVFESKHQKIPENQNGDENSDSLVNCWCDPSHPLHLCPHCLLEEENHLQVFLAFV